MHTTIKKLAQQGKSAAQHIARTSLDQRNAVLKTLKTLLHSEKEILIEANICDIAQAHAQGLKPDLLERLSIQTRIDGMIDDLSTIIDLPDPLAVNHSEDRRLPNGLCLSKRPTPIGLLGVIYESRPNVTLDIAALAIKSGNAALLRGGAESRHTNRALMNIIHQSLIHVGLPAECLLLVDSTDRNDVKKMLKLDKYIDLIIPRGGTALQALCRRHSTIPVITGGVGICHLFVDESAIQARALEVIINAKVQRPTVCNALDSLLVHASIAEVFIPLVIEALTTAGVELRLDAQAMAYATGGNCRLATPDDWHTEWLSLVLGIKIVQDITEAMRHIALHSRGHSDGILTENPLNADIFTKEVDSAVVYVNASTRFTDGGQFGLGGEVAVSTQKLHARGPMGLASLTTYKWAVHGDYQIRS
jgi:glutamate-5-semialdehyde dehydrogenase